MRIAYTTIYDAHDISQYSGMPYHMSRALENEGVDIDYIGPLLTQMPRAYRFKQLWKRLTFGQRESSRFNMTAIKNYSKQVGQQLAQLNIDAILSPTVIPVAYLDCKQPLIVWTDAIYAGMLGFYPSSSSVSAKAIQQGNQITMDCLSRCALAIYSSDWAARSAIELYGIKKEKVKVVPFGANIEVKHTTTDIHEMLKHRPRNKIKLLFLGRGWHVKGADIVFDVAKALHASGQPVELNFVGCIPPKNIEIPSYIKCHGFVSKRTPEGAAKIKQLLRESHFLFVPSRAEAYGIVFCEANAFGLPCLTSYVGGIPTIVKDDINGMTFSRESTIEEYCHYIIDVMSDYSRYEALAFSSFHEYETRLNWQVATQTVKQLIQEIL